MCGYRHETSNYTDSLIYQFNLIISRNKPAFLEHMSSYHLSCFFVISCGLQQEIYDKVKKSDSNSKCIIITFYLTTIRAVLCIIL